MSISTFIGLLLVLLIAGAFIIATIFWVSNFTKEHVLKYERLKFRHQYEMRMTNIEHERFVEQVRKAAYNAGYEDAKNGTRHKYKEENL
jgi:hypothetical protein